MLGSFAQRVLLAAEPAHKPAAANLATRFEAPQRPEDFSPRKRKLFALDDGVEHHTPTSQELLGDGLRELITICIEFVVDKHRPPALATMTSRCTSPQTSTDSIRPLATIARIEQRTDCVEAVRMDQTSPHELPQPLLDIGGDAAGASTKLMMEPGSTCSQLIENLASTPIAEIIRSAIAADRSDKPLEIVTERERDRCCLCRRGAS